MAAVLVAAALMAANANAHGGGGGGGGGGHSSGGTHSSSGSTKSLTRSSGSSQSNYKKNNLPILLLNNNSNNSTKKKTIGSINTIGKTPILGTTPITTGVGSGKPVTIGNGKPISIDPTKTTGILPVGPGQVPVGGKGTGNGTNIPIDPGKGNGTLPPSGTTGTGIGGTGNGSGMAGGNGKGHHHGACWNNFLFLGLGFPNYGLYSPFGGTTGYNSSGNYVTPVSAVATPAPIVEGIDLQLVDVRLLDSGRADEQIGPRYRISFRNAGGAPVDHEFNVALMAATEMKASDDQPQTFARVSSVKGNDVSYVDLRLPATVFQMTTAKGKTEFSKLLVFVDSNQEIKDTHRENNMAGLDRTAIKTAE